MYIADVLKENNIPVKILDAFLDGWDSISTKLKLYRPDVVGITYKYLRAGRGH